MSYNCTLHILIQVIIIKKRSATYSVIKAKFSAEDPEAILNIFCAYFYLKNNKSLIFTDL